MKRFCIFASVVLFAAISCQKEVVEVVYDVSDLQNTEAINDVEMSDNQYFISENDAISCANSFFTSGNATRSVEKRVKSCEVFVANSITRNQNSSEVLFYLINYENNQGYALVSSDQRATPVYMYANEGNIEISDLHNHPGFTLFLESAVPNYQKEIELYNSGEGRSHIITDIIPPDLIDLPTEMYNGVAYFCKTIQERIITEPLVYAYWHQGFPYNKYAYPYTGCGINSVGQIMSYYEHPTSYNGSVYDWTLINSASVYNEECLASNMIAQLMYDMGDYLGVTYESDGTSTTSAQSRNLFLEFGYSCSQVVDYRSDIIENDINNGRPVWIRGDSANGNAGHAWVIDGYDMTNITKEYYMKVSPYSLCHRTRQQGNIYFRCIWGYLNHYQPTYCLRLDFYQPCNNRLIHNIRPIN